MARLDFNSEGIDTTDTYEPLPAGKYKAMVTRSDLKATKAGTGQYLELELDIVDGAFTGRKLFDRLNIDNPNPTAVAIAQKQLAQLCQAVGIAEVMNSEELHDTPVIVRITIGKARDGYAPQNEIRGYSPISGSQSVEGKITAPSTGLPNVHPTSTPKAPWTK